MSRTNSTIATLAVAAVAVTAAGSMLLWQPHGLAPNALAQSNTASGKPATGTERAADPVWAASATGRVEPRGGEVRLFAPVAGQISDVIVAENDRMFAGDLMVKLDDGDHLARIAAAKAETLVRRKERNEEKTEPATGLALDRRNAEDRLETAETELFEARQSFDALLAKRKTGNATTEIVNLRQQVAQKESAVEEAKRQLDRLEANEQMPLPDRLEAALTQARSDLRLAYEALERTRIRAPKDGTVLRVDAKIGELAGPSSPAPLLSFGDLSKLMVKAEVEDRDIDKVHVGQRVVVRVDAFPGQDFKGRVSSMAAALGAPLIASRGPRRPNDIDVLEVMVTLDDGQKLLTGMRVDTFFVANETASAPTRQTQ